MKRKMTVVTEIPAFHHLPMVLYATIAAVYVAGVLAQLANDTTDVHPCVPGKGLQS